MKTRVKLGMSDMNVPELLGFATQIVSKMTGNKFFPSPAPPLSRVNEATRTLQDAFNLAQGGGTAHTAAMEQNRELLENLLNSLGHHVEDVANDVVNAETGARTIILSAGMNVKDFSAHQKQTFGVKHGRISGSVALTGSSINRGSHEWQYSTDPSNSNNWIDAEPTVRASTTINGLEVGKRYYFRHRILNPEGLTEWDEPESIIVV